ncbi:MAG: 4-(cytidine 5'-diphospho)-2-C-methyl-D-erythritol kinase [Collinsella intestinalis]
MPAPNPAFDPLRAAGVRAEAPQGRFMLITAPAKINLYLGVHEQTDEEGYHGVDTVMTTLDIADTLAIAPSDRLMVKTVPEADFPQESNSAYKAAVAMGEAFGREPNFAILIDKHIPIRAGLGGPSTDAAATIMGICRYWGVDPRDERIDAVARSIGADVPFFLYGPPAHLDGRGDTMREMFRPLTGTPVALVKPMSGQCLHRRGLSPFRREPTARGRARAHARRHARPRQDAVFSHVSNNLAVARRLCPKSARFSIGCASSRTSTPSMSADPVPCFAVCKTQMAAEKIALPP